MCVFPGQAFQLAGRAAADPQHRMYAVQSGDIRKASVASAVAPTGRVRGDEVRNVAGSQFSPALHTCLFQLH